MKNKKVYIAMLIYIGIIAYFTILDKMDIYKVENYLYIALFLISAFKFFTAVPMGDESYGNLYAKMTTSNHSDQRNLLTWKMYFVLIIPLCIAILVLTYL